MKESMERKSHSHSSQNPVSGNLLAAACPSRQILDHVTSMWGTLALVVLTEKTYRFSELRKKIGGVSEKMLAQTLQNLEADGFVSRRVYPVVPPKVEYSLTELGLEVAKRLRALTQCVEVNLPQVVRSRAEYARQKTGR